MARWPSIIPLAALLAPRRARERRRFGSERADDLARLRARFTAQPRAGALGVRARELAVELLRLKRALAVASAGATSCSGCAGGCARPTRGDEEDAAWSGGRCCGGTRTLDVFTQAEVRAMKAAGSPAPDEAGGRALGAGCAFRGPSGCSLQPERRPVRCLLYECDRLQGELDASATATERRGRRLELARAFERFVEVSGAESTGAELTGAELTGAELTAADFTGAPGSRPGTTPTTPSS